MQNVSDISCKRVELKEEKVGNEHHVYTTSSTSDKVGGSLQLLTLNLQNTLIQLHQSKKQKVES